MQFVRPQDERYPLTKVVVGLPQGGPITMIMDDSHNYIDIPDEATYANAYPCNARGDSQEAPIVLLAPEPEPEPEPEPKQVVLPTFKVLHESRSSKETHVEE